MKVGLTFGVYSAIAGIETESSGVDCLEVDIKGFFARLSPYLRWLGERYQLVLRASPLSLGASGPLPDEGVAALGEVLAEVAAEYVVHPLGFERADDVPLPAALPVNPSSASLETVVRKVIETRRHWSTPDLLEPITSPLRIPGEMTESEFINEACRKADCGLLIDVGALLAASRNFRVDPRDWLRRLDGDRIAVARLTGCSIVAGRWVPDSGVSPDATAWALMREVVTCGDPEIVMLGSVEHDTGLRELHAQLERLRNVRNDYVGIVVDENPQPAEIFVLSGPHAEPDASSEVGATLGGDDRRPVIAEDVSLFVLDDAGLFFSAAKQELSLFNAAAALVWCLLEEGLATPEIIQAYQQSFGIDHGEATTQVSSILQKWFGRGYISKPKLDVQLSIPLTTAVAQLVTNPAFREQFRTSPQEVAASLHVAPTDVENFVRIDAHEVDVQAEMHARQRPSSAFVNLLERRAAEYDAAERVVPSNQFVRTYRLGTASYQLRTNSAALDALINQALSHLERAASTQDVVLEIHDSPTGTFTILHEGSVVRRCGLIAQVVPTVMRILRETSVARSNGVMRVHGALVSTGSECLLMPAAAGSGKTTLTAALIAEGLTYFSDEVALVEHAGLAVRPFPMPLTIKDGAREVLRQRYPELPQLPLHIREDYQEIRYLPPPVSSMPLNEEDLPVGWVVFPRYDEAAPTEMRHISRSAAIAKMLRETVVDFTRLGKTDVEALVESFRRAECFDLSVGSLEAAVTVLRESALRR